MYNTPPAIHIKGSTVGGDQVIWEERLCYPRTAIEQCCYHNYSVQWKHFLDSNILP